MRNDLNWPVPDEPVSPESINEVGNQIGCTFPRDYVECAVQNNGLECCHIILMWMG